MIGNQIIQNSIDELKAITHIDLEVIDLDGTQVASTYEGAQISPVSIRSFVDSPADSQVVFDRHLFKVTDGEELSYVLIAEGNSEDSYMTGRIAVSQLKNLIIAYKERFDKNNFFQNLLLDNMLLIDIYNRAKKLKIPIEQKRCVFLVEMVNGKDNIAMETLKSLFPTAKGDFVTAVDEKNIIIVKALADEGAEDLQRIAMTIVDMINTEAMVDVRVTYGTVINDLKEVSRSYKEAQMAIDVGRIFYDEKVIIPYDSLGIGRLIYQLPTSLCEIFMREIFGDKIPDDLDEEILTTINKFFENNLNVSETSRQLYVHRNTLVYRIEKLQKSTGLDIRIFDDALTLKIALMVVSYMKYLREKGMV